MILMAALLISQTSLQVFASPTGAGSNFQGAVKDWVARMDHTPDPSAGCFSASYPDTVWLEVPCAKVNDSVPPNPPLVSYVNDYSDLATSSLIGYAHGDFASVSGVTSENDSLNPCNMPKSGDCANWYSVQLNSNTWSPSQSTPCPDYSGYNGATSGYTCWEQFVFNNGQYGSNGYIWYILGGYAKNIGPCGAIYTPPGMVQWFSKSTDPSQSCYSYVSPGKGLLPAPISQLSDVSVSGSSNLQGSGNDQITICVTGQSPSCDSGSYTDTVLELYKAWQVSEFNVFGYGGGSEAVFYGATGGSAATITPNVEEEDSSGRIIPSNCQTGGYTGETNSMGLVSCRAGNVMSITESESSYYLTMQVKSGSGTVSPSSGYYLPGTRVTITGTATGGRCNSFYNWSGSGSGSYTGFNNPATITMNGPISEGATFKKVCAPSG